MTSSPGAALFLMQAAAPVLPCRSEVGAAAPGFALDDPAVTHGHVSISAGDTSCQQKADEKMKEIQRERLSLSLRCMPVKAALLRGFWFRFSPRFPCSSPALCLAACLCHTAYLCLLRSAAPPVRLHPPACPFASPNTCHLLLNLQLSFRPLSPPMMWTSTLRLLLMRRSTAASREPRSSWRSDTATAWRG